MRPHAERAPGRVFSSLNIWLFFLDLSHSLSTFYFDALLAFWGVFCRFSERLLWSINIEFTTFFRLFCFSLPAQ